MLITASFNQRKSRTPNYQTEARSLQSLAIQLADAPEAMLQSLVDIARAVCGAGTAGISVLDHNGSIFRWVALSGALGAYVGGSTPRAASPCGVCLDAGCPQAFAHPGRYFSALADASPAIVEGLVIPVVDDEGPLGTIWIVSHDQARTFDAEDARLMTSLAAFTATALRVQSFRQDKAIRAAETALRDEWLRRLIDVQEKERRRIARELHDEVGAQLITLRFAAARATQAEFAGRRLQEGLDRLEGSLRRIARELRPAVLDDVGLDAAIQQHLDEWSAATGVAVEYAVRGISAHTSTAIESTVYRIIQEALTNVARHAGANQVSVTLDFCDARVFAIVEDDGRGLSATAQAQAVSVGRLGIVGMRERAALLGGHVTIESAAGNGVRVLVSIPVDHGTQPPPPCRPRPGDERQSNSPD